MKTIYLDLMGGISGDMLIAAFLDFGMPFSELKKELAKIRLSGYTLKKRRVMRGHVDALKFDVVLRGEKSYSYQAILRLIKNSRLRSGIKNNIFKVYHQLAEAERKVHGHKHGDIHFEQLGQIDTIVDVAAACICLDRLGISKIYYSLIPVNNQIAPATFELLENKVVYFTGNLYENVTPTGMAFLAAFGTQIEPEARGVVKIGHCGYGAGDLNPSQVCNALRAAEILENKSMTEKIQVVQANIDDMNPQVFEDVFENLFKAGALDVFLENITMKKSRPGFLLTVLTNEENLVKIVHLVLKETSTIGVRFYPVLRIKLNRRFKKIKVRGVGITVKSVQLPHGKSRSMPEYEDCRRLAAKTRTPVLKIMEEVKAKLNG